MAPSAQTIVPLVQGATHLAGRRPRFFYLVSLPLWLATVIRAFDEGDRARLPLTLVLLGVFLALFLSEHWIAQRIDRYTTLYFAMELGIVFALMTAQPELDFFAVLLIPVSAQIALLPSTRQRRWWFAATVAVMACGLLLYQDFPRSLAMMLLYGAGYLLIASYASVTEHAERAEAQSQELVAELQEANRQLIESTATIEALAVVQERNRLARELHDSVSQSLYGLTLSAEAARRNLASGNISGSVDELESMSVTAREALAEMRLLIYELRPAEIENFGLQRALDARLETVERRAGLQAHLDYRVDRDLPLRTEIELERIATEALTNVVRHAHATSVDVTVLTAGERVLLEVRDDGMGFDPASRVRGFGLRGMQERAERLGGTLSIDAQTNAGTRVRLDAPL